MDEFEVRRREPFKFHEGWLERKIEKSNKWEELWLTLKGNFIFIFTHGTVHNEDTHMGKLPINSNTKFERKRSQDERKGYIFEIYTTNDGKSWRHKFKTDKKSDMEMWRGYITGLAKGALPNDLDLPGNVIEDMDILLHQHAGNPLLRSSLIPGNSMESFDSGRASITSPTRSMRSMAEHSSSGSEGTNATFTSNRSGGSGGRIKRHKFSNDPYGDDTPPSWFFPHCSRDFARSIFKAKGCRYGDTLMRESSNNAANGDYVITHCSGISLDGEPKCDHYKVVRTAKGYELYVENPHDEVKNLTDVMLLFVKINGPSRTQPMTTNNLATLGLESPDHGYSSYVPQAEPTRRVNIPNFNEPPPAAFDQDDYLEPSRRRPQTFSPGVFNKQQQMYDQQKESAANQDVVQRRVSVNKTVTPRNVQSMYSQQQFSLPRVTTISRQRLPSDQSSLPPPSPHHKTKSPVESHPPSPHNPKIPIGYENDNSYDDTATRILRPPSFRAPSPPVTFNRQISDNARKTRSMSVPFIQFQATANSTNSGLTDKVTHENVISSPPKSILVKEKKKEENQAVNTRLSVTGLRKVEQRKSESDNDRENQVTSGIETASPGSVFSQVQKFQKNQSSPSVQKQEKQATDVAKNTEQNRGPAVAQKGVVTNPPTNPTPCNPGNVYANTGGIYVNHCDDEEVYDDTGNTVTGAKADFRKELDEKLRKRMEKMGVSPDSPDYENIYEDMIETLAEEDDH